MDPELNNVPLNTMVADTENIPTHFLELLPLGVCVCDAQGMIKQYNSQVTHLWGRIPQSGERFCGACRFYYPDGRYLPHEETPMAACLVDGLPRKDRDLLMEKPDGYRIMVRINIAPIVDKHGAIKGMVSSYQQGPSKEEAVLQESEQLYHKMIEEIDDYAILLMDKEGIIRNWNRGAEKIKGYKDYEIIGKSFRLFYLPEDQESGLPQKLINEAHRTGKAVQEGWRRRKDGTRFWGGTVITALHDADNNVIGFSKVTRDLTDKKRAEDKINQYAKELEFQNRELEQFAYAAAHDMKEPLRKIQFYADYIYEHTGQLPEKVKDYLGRSIKAASRMNSLIDDLLAYSKASAFTQNMEAVNLNDLLKEVIAANRESLENHNAVVEVDTLPVVRAVPFQFSQLFDNLLNNSLKYRHPHRAPHIRISAEKLQVAASPISERRSSCFYKISFQDNGIGFDPTYAVKIFDLFQRLHTQSDYAGSGVGLAICKKIIQNHHGFIQAKGELGEGALFEMYIPCEA